MKGSKMNAGGRGGWGRGRGARRRAGWGPGGGQGMGRGAGRGYCRDRGLPDPFGPVVEPKRPRPTAVPGAIAAVDGDECVGCAICVEACAEAAILVEDVANIDTEKCIGCGACVDECPTEAISLVEP